MTAFALLFTLSAIGISETVYLIQKRRADQRPACVVGEGTCHLVLYSKWNKTLGIHNDVLGFVFYFVMSFITAFTVLEIESLEIWKNIAYIGVAFGCLFSLYFIFLQWKVIKVWCFWCLMSAATIGLMTLIVLITNLRI